MERKTVDKIILIIFLMLLIGNSFLFGYIIKYKNAFFENPLAFGIAKYEDNFQCTCYGNEKTLIFNETTIKISKGDFFEIKN